MTLPTVRLGNPVASNSEDPRIQSIVNNLKAVLQSRRTIGSGQKIGLLDYSDQLLGDPLMNQLCADMAQQIDFHEPRLDPVEISLIESNGNFWRMSLNAKLKQRHNEFDINSPQQKTITCILELVKPAYLQNMREVKVVVL